MTTSQFISKSEYMKHIEKNRINILNKFTKDVIKIVKNEIQKAMDSNISDKTLITITIPYKYEDLVDEYNRIVTELFDKEREWTIITPNNPITLRRGNFLVFQMQVKS